MTATYRSGKRKRQPEVFTKAQITEGLSLLQLNDYSNLLHRRTSLIRGSLTWARIANACAHGLAEMLLKLHSDESLREAVAFTDELAQRLEKRDATKQNRITTETRDAVMRVTKVGLILNEMLTIREGGMPTDNTAGRATTLRSLWSRLQMDLGRALNPYVQKLVEQATAAVLASSSASGSSRLG